MKLSSSLKIVLIAVMALFLTVAASQTSLAQRPGGGGPPAEVDVLAGLKRALTEAGAADLSAQQEQQLKALIQQTRQAAGSQRPDPDAHMDAQRAYENAIMAGNASAANAQAQTIASTLSANVSGRLQGKASFDIQALAILKSNQQQFNALLARFGSKGVFNLVDSLIGGGGPQGGPFGQGAPGGQGGPGGRPFGGGPRLGPPSRP